MNLITYQATGFTSRVANDNTYRNWLSVYKIFDDKNLGLNDRTGYITFPIQTIVPKKFCLPSYQSFNDTYKDCCLNRANEILAKFKTTRQPIKLMYSGGIDSSVILATFIDLLGIDQAKKIITIIMNKESIDENPVMWHKFIRPHFNIEPSDKNYSGKDISDWIFVTGELNDQLFGSDIQQDVANWGGQNFLNSQISVGALTDYLKQGKRLEDSHANLWANVFIENLKSCPNHNNTMWDVFWWYNFTWKWIYVYYRIFMFSKISGRIDYNWMNNYYFPFFSTKEFQLWSLNHNEPKHLGTWDSYKHVAKKYVCEVLGDNSYMAKVKRQSLKNILYMRMRNYSIDENENLIDNQDVDLSQVYNENNFIDRYAKNLGI